MSILSGERPVVYLVGPTATGKTRLAVELGQRFPAEIINADSRQVYRHMDIGTAKPSPEEQSTVRHHLLDLFPPDESFSLGAFLALARQSVADIRQRGRLPLVVGGTGQYTWALEGGWDVPEVAPDPVFRRELETEARQRGAEVLYERLRAIDPQRAGELDLRNVRRVIRALEVHHVTGRNPSSFGKRADLALPGLVIGLTMERSTLYGRIDRRVDQMMEAGFLEEVNRLSAMGYSLGNGPLAGPGYTELGQYLSGSVRLEEAVQRTKFQTHRLARKQYSWFKPDDGRIQWLDGSEPGLICRAESLIQARLKGLIS